jgi:hypothetical protein
VFSGISQESLSAFAPQLVASGLLPVSGVGGARGNDAACGSNWKHFSTGKFDQCALVRGDYSLAAAARDMRDGDRIYRFWSSVPEPRRFGYADDRSFGRHRHFQHEQLVQAGGARANGWLDLTGSRSGIFGMLRQAPKMIPVKVSLHTSRDRTDTYSYEIANDSFLTPLLLNITLFNTITSSERALATRRSV